MSEVRSVYRLLGEVRELGNDPLAWRKHLLNTLAALIGAAVGVAAEIGFPDSLPVLRPESLAAIGLAVARDWRWHVDFLASPEAARCPVFHAIAGWQSGCHTRHYREGWIDASFDAETWRTSAFQAHHRAAGLGSLLFSKHALPGPPAIHAIALERVEGERPFREGQRRLLQLFHEELGRLWQPPADAELAGLSPRLRQTLDGLLMGQAEKEVAATLGISRHTVHNYVKELHRRFHVTSRGELCACCAARRPATMVHLSEGTSGLIGVD